MYKHVLLVAELTALAQKVTEEAAEMSKTYSSKLTLAHVIEDIPTYDHPLAADMKNRVVMRAKKEIAKLGKKLGVAETEQRIEYGPIKKQVLKLAKELDIDLIIVGSHARHGFSHLLNSSANAIMEAAECDVLIMRVNAEI
ncbi:MAG: universal stress protein [Gammaproteobacteria bacterium]